MRDRQARRPALVVLLFICVIAAIASLWLAIGALPQPEPGPQAGSGEAALSPAAAAGSAAGVASPAGPVSSTPAKAPAQTPAAPSAAPPEAARLDPPLPALLGSIGDSISVAFDVTPATFGPNPTHSWVTGTAPGDGVFSILERLQSLGGSPAVADEARAGARMADAARQATLVVRAAAGLPPGSTALVTIELGGNDACAGTAPAAFERQLRAAIAILRDGTTVDGKRLAGLPGGSRLLVLSSPDVARLRTLTAGLPRAQEIYRGFGLCSRFLGPSVSDAQLAAGRTLIGDLNAVLKRVCDGVEASSGSGDGTGDGTGGGLHCRSDQGAGAAGSMFGSAFGLADVSELDYFHPSLAGQARIADGAWAAGYWASVPLTTPPPAPSGSVP